MKSKVILVGGFLGAGKTSLLWEAARRIKAMGHTVGLITNDQAPNLVDTIFLQSDSNLVQEVSGSCFCCNFDGFSQAISALHGGGCAVVLAEPVGSCTDLSATLMQPQKDMLADLVDPAPLTVLADPARLSECLDHAGKTSNYILEKQLDEADLIVIGKIDLLAPAELELLQKKAFLRWPGARVLAASTKTGVGVDAWIDAVLHGTSAGERLATVDYDLYAQGEAAFAWLNAEFSLATGQGGMATEAAAFLEHLEQEFHACHATVGHVKFLLQSPEGQSIGNLTGGMGGPTLRQAPVRSSVASLTVNARVEMPPDALQRIVLQAVECAFGRFHCQQTALKCLIPGRPNPTHRYRHIVSSMQTH